jgi:hypothetical protein
MMSFVLSQKPAAGRSSRITGTVLVALFAVGLLLCASTSAVTLTTASGSGADAEVNENSNAAFDGGSGTGTALNSRFNNLDRNEYIALRFDLGGYAPAGVSNAAIELVNHRTNSALALRFYGVAAGTVGKDGNGVIRGYTTENWSESDIRFSTLPGLDWDGAPLTRSQDLPNLVDLGTQMHGPVDEGTTFVFTNAALTTFLQAHPANAVTFLVMRDTTSGFQTRFASKESTATGAGVLNGAAGDFAPRLVFDYVSSAAPTITGLINQTNSAGNDVTFNPVVTGVPAPALQWRENGVNLPGETNAALTLLNIQPAQNGYVYSLVASNSAGAVTNSAALIVLAPPTRAFPGAEGAGAGAKGGRGGDVYYVTSLSDANTAGTLRYGINNAPAGGRSILFKVSGNIALTSTLTINKPRITIAGQTAPGDGICLQNYSFNIAANDIVVRHLRSRLGTNALQEGDGMWINSGTNIVVDHLSASWSVDETLSSSRTVANLTVQNCFITESLRNSIHEKGAHGYGGIASSEITTTYTYHRNLYAHHSSRSPRLGSDSQSGILRLDFRNNVIYNWGFRAGYSGDTNETTELNYVGNYLVAGPSSTYNFAFLSGGLTTSIYQSGNFIDTDKDGLVDGANTGWSMFSGTMMQTNAPFAVPEATTETAGTAYQRVLAQSGAMPWRRDANDQRIVRTVRTQTGQLVDFISPTTFSGDYVTNNINGTNYIGVNPWPTLAAVAAPLDTDNDGMPNFWELAMGLATNNAADRNLTNALGYTRLEEYLNWLADPHTLCDRNGYVDFDLRAANGGATNLAFAVAGGTNGSATLLGDGYTARFTATNNYSGLASFTFTATDPANGLSFGPESIGVLVTTTNAPNTPPMLTAIGDYTLVAGATLSFTNNASDNDVPAQTLTFTLLDNPGGASLTTNSGVFVWRPTLTHSGTTNAMKIVVADSGSPTMSATQSFTVFVTVPAVPALQSSVASNGQFSFLVTGDAGPDYAVQASTNLVNWTDVTNFASPVVPFTWADTNAANFKQRFYRVLLGP